MRLLLLPLILVPIWAVWAWSANSTTLHGYQLNTVAGHEELSMNTWISKLASPELEDCSELREHLADVENALVATAERNGVRFELEYRPAVCAACIELRSSSLDDQVIRQRVADFSKSSQYLLRIAKSSAASQDLEMNASIQNALFEIHGADTLPCAFVHKENLPEMVPYAQFLLGFDRPQDGAPGQLLLKDLLAEFGGDVLFTIPRHAVQTYLSMLPHDLKRAQP